MTTDELIQRYAQTCLDLAAMHKRMDELSGALAKIAHGRPNSWAADTALAALARLKDDDS